MADLFLIGTNPTQEKIVEYGGDLYYFHANGVDVYDPAAFPWTRAAWVQEVGTTAGAVNADGVFLAGSSGVYHVAHGSLSGDSTASKSLKYSTGTTPAIQSNAVRSMAGQGSGLAIATDAGVDWVPDTSGSSLWSYTDAAGCDAVAVSSADLAYQVDGIAVHVLAKPTADWVSGDVRDVISLGGGGTLASPDDATNYTPPEGTISASQEHTTYYAWKAFRLGNYQWRTSSGQVPAWLEFEFGTAIAASHFRIQSYAFSASFQPYGNPKDFTIQGWNGTSWDTLYSATGFTWPNGSTWSADLPSSDSTTTYNRFRLNVTAVGRDDYVMVGEFEIYEAATGAALSGNAVRDARYGTDLFLATDAGIAVWDGTTVTEFDAAEVGSVVDVQSVSPSSTATDATGRVGYGTRDGVGGGRFGVLALATATNEHTVSGDVRAAYVSDDGSRRAWERTYTEDLVLSVPAVGVGVAASVPAYVSSGPLYRPPAVGVEVTAGVPTLTAGPTTIAVPAVEIVVGPAAPAWARDAIGGDVTYECVLTGAADGVADAVLPVSSIEARVRDGDPTWLSVTVPNAYAHAATVAARPNGQIVIRRGVRWPDGARQLEEIGRADLETIQDDRGGRRASMQLSGHAAVVTQTPKARTMRGTSFRHAGTGQRRYRCVPDHNLRPGDTAVFPALGESIEVGVISWSVAERSEQMELTEAEA